MDLEKNNEFMGYKNERTDSTSIPHPLDTLYALVQGFSCKRLPAHGILGLCIKIHLGTIFLKKNLPY
jgi:hypothetical protein